MQTKQIATPLDLELELDFPEASCILDSQLAKELEYCAAELLWKTGIVSSNISRGNSVFRPLWNLHDIVEKISGYLRLVTRNKSFFSRAAPEITKNNHAVYLLARESSQQIETFLWKFSLADKEENTAKSLAKEFSGRLQEKLIQNTKTIHAWVNHLLKLSSAASQTKN
ncbi:MAG: hypothetical protein LBJ25_04140 [Candidatus Margulisbacteria bacterium]|jgi:hypothetical protein|nr:hypothetical protein [Candidatus Margulisiibacteriota bacterium]